METNTAPTQAVPAAPAAPAPVAPDLSKMTGAEAKAWVEAQKTKEPGKAPPKADPYRTDSKPAATTDIVKEAAIEAKRKLKIDNDEIDEDEVIKIYKERKGHQKAANEKLQEGLRARQQAEEFVQMMRDPDKAFEVLGKMGHDARALAEKYLVAKLEDEMLDPRDRELKDAKMKLKAIEDMEKQQKTQVEQERISVLKEKFAQDYTTQFTEALKQTSIPATKGTVAEMAKYIARSAEIGFKMTALEAAQLVKEDMVQAQQRLIGDTDGEMLIKLLGEDVANKIRKWDTSRLRTTETPAAPQINTTERKDRRPPNKRMSPKEWREYNRR